MTSRNRFRASPSERCQSQIRRRAMDSRKRAAMLALLVSASTAFDHSSQAAGFSTGPVRIVVPYPAGGPVDIVGRIVAQKLTEKLGTRFYVENQPGAGGTIGAAAVARAPADGQTILLMNQDFVVEPVVKA